MWKLEADLKNAFPSYLEEEIVNILSHTSAKQSVPTYASQPFGVLVNSEKINIPYRHTLDTPHPSNTFKYMLSNKIILSDIQQSIVDCFYTRHCDGRIREQSLKKIILLDHEWVVPYVVQLIGEYVIEILEIIYQKYPPNNPT